MSQSSDTEQTSTPAKPSTKMIAASLLTVAAVFLTAAILGGMWLTGQWNGTGRQTPVESVNGFLTALLTERDAQEASSFVCQSLSGNLHEAFDLLESLPEAGLGEATANFTWENVTEVSRDTSTAVVTADVTLDITGETAQWSFAVVTGDPDDSWRVCGVVTGS